MSASITIDLKAVRGVKQLTLRYKGESITFDMPGWYSETSDESIHSGEDMKVSDRVLNRLKARVEGLLEPEEIRQAACSLVSALPPSSGRARLGPSSRCGSSPNPE